MVYVPSGPPQIDDAQAKRVIDYVMQELQEIARETGEQEEVLTETYRRHVDIREHGAVGDGVTNNAGAIQAALDAGAGGTVYIPEGVFDIGTSVSVPVGTELCGSGPGSHIRVTDPLSSGIVSVEAAGISLHDFKVSYSATGVNSNTGAIYLFGCFFPSVKRIEVTDHVSLGIALLSCQFGTVEDNYIHTARVQTTIGPPGNAADIALYGVQSYNSGRCNYNLVRNNRCYGGAHVAFGILIQDYDFLSELHMNKIVHNHIGTHQAYGIINYNGTHHYNSFILIDGNTVEDITGLFDAFNFEGSAPGIPPAVTGFILDNGAAVSATNIVYQAGAGIYTVNAGGVQVINNTIRNCCQHTNYSNEGPAAIGVTNEGDLDLASCIVDGNYIEMYKKHGIQLSGCEGRVSNNTVYMSSAALNVGQVDTQDGIFILGDINVVTVGNKVRVASGCPAKGIVVQASAQGDITDTLNSVTNDNVVSTDTGDGISIQATSPRFVSGVCEGNSLAVGATATCIRCTNCATMSVSNNVAALGQKGLVLNNCSTMRCVGNNLQTSQSEIETQGTCVNNTIDMTNLRNFSKINNAVAGNLVELNDNAAPTSGTFQRGDHCRNVLPAVGSPKDWYCTVAGTSGTWVSGGNL